MERQLNKQERILLDFHKKWMPFDGPDPEDIFVEFGISIIEYRKRISEIISAGGDPKDRSM